MELAKDMYDSLVQFLDKYSSSNTRKDEIKKVQKMVEVLKGLLENLK
jgi:Mor family transcriptional regulator